MVKQHHIIKETTESIGQLLQETFREAGYRRVHLVHSPPNRDAIEGKLPAVSIYLHNLVIDEEGIGSHRVEQRIEQVTQADGSTKEIARDPPLWVRLDYLVSPWAQTPEEEQLLIGLAIKCILEHPTMSGAQLKGEAMSSVEEIPLLMSQRLDETLLSRFWSSVGQPLKPAVQCWTTIPIYPDKEYDVHRVVEREVRFFDLNKVQRAMR